MIIYKATNKINNKIYIGQTIQDFKVRRRQHENSYLYPSSVGSRGIFSRAINKYGKENFEWEVIDRADSLEELNEKEEYWIDKCNSLKEGGWGYNIKKGGDNHKHAERTKKLIGLAQVGEKNHMYGKVGKLSPSSRPVKDMQTNKVYSSATECAEDLGLTISKICAVCRGDGVCYLFDTIWCYENTEKERIDNFVIPNKKKPYEKLSKRVLNITTGEVFDSIAEAARSVDASKSGLARALKVGEGKCRFKDNQWKLI